MTNTIDHAMQRRCCCPSLSGGASSGQSLVTVLEPCGTTLGCFPNFTALAFDSFFLILLQPRWLLPPAFGHHWQMQNACTRMRTPQRAFEINIVKPSMEQIEQMVVVWVRRCLAGSWTVPGSVSILANQRQSDPFLSLVSKFPTFAWHLLICYWLYLMRQRCTLTNCNEK